MGTDGRQRELRQVTGRLIDEFGDRIAVATIVRVAREEVLLFDRAKVRDFVAIIAWRLARDRLAESPQTISSRDHLPDAPILARRTLGRESG